MRQAYASILQRYSDGVRELSTDVPTDVTTDGSTGGSTGGSTDGATDGAANARLASVCLSPTLLPEEMRLVFYNPATFRGRAGLLPLQVRPSVCLCVPLSVCLRVRASFCLAVCLRST